jgi:hypothetical protein
MESKKKSTKSSPCTFHYCLTSSILRYSGLNDQNIRNREASNLGMWPSQDPMYVVIQHLLVDNEWTVRSTTHQFHFLHTPSWRSSSICFSDQCSQFFPVGLKTDPRFLKEAWRLVEMPAKTLHFPRLRLIMGISRPGSIEVVNEYCNERY